MVIIKASGTQSSYSQSLTFSDWFVITIPDVMGLEYLIYRNRYKDSIGYAESSRFHENFKEIEEIASQLVISPHSSPREMDQLIYNSFSQYGGIQAVTYEYVATARRQERRYNLVYTGSLCRKTLVRQETIGHPLESPDQMPSTRVGCVIL